MITNLRRLIAESKGPYRAVWHEQGQGWIEIRRYVELDGFDVDVNEVQKLETFEFSPS